MSSFGAQLLYFENRVPYAYQDHLGYWTIGDGILIDKRKGGGLLPEEMDFIRENRRRRIESRLDQDLGWWRGLNEPRQTVLLLMAWQMGVDGLLTFHRTLEFVRIGRWVEAAKGMRNSLWHAQTPLRCEKMAVQMETGEWVPINEELK